MGHTLFTYRDLKQRSRKFFQFFCLVHLVLEKLRLQG